MASSWTTPASASPTRPPAGPTASSTWRTSRPRGAKFYTDGNALKQDFQTGKITAVVDGPWQTADFTKALGDNLAVAPIPPGTGKANPLTGTDGWYINPNSKNKDLAVKLALQLVGTASEQTMTTTPAMSLRPPA